MYLKLAQDGRVVAKILPPNQTSNILAKRRNCALLSRKLMHWFHLVTNFIE